MRIPKDREAGRGEREERRYGRQVRIVRDWDAGRGERGERDELREAGKDRQR